MIYYRRVLFGILKIVCALLLLGGMFMGYKAWQTQVGKQSQAQEAFSRELRPLTLRKRELELEIQSLDKEYTRIVAGLATTQILAVNSGDWVDEKLFPALQEAEMVGTVAMSLDKMPGEEDALTELQIQKLEDAGWQLIFAFDESEFESREKDVEKELAKWLRREKWKYKKENLARVTNEKEQEFLTEEFKEWKKNVQNRYGELGIELDNVIYFKKGTYQRSYDSALRAAGFDMVIHHGEEERILYADLSENRIWFPGAVPWNVAYLTEHIDTLVELGANLVWTVSEPGDNEQEQFLDESFSSMLRQLDGRRDEGLLEVCTFREMANFQAKSVVDKNAKENDRKKLIAQEELDAVNAQIREVYTKYGMD